MDDVPKDGPGQERPFAAHVRMQACMRRLCSHMLCATCVAPVLVIASTVVLGWDEHEVACTHKAIDHGKEEVVEVGCDSPSAGDGELVLFSCPLSQAGLAPLTAVESDFAAVLSHMGTGLNITAEMLQCVETEHRYVLEDANGGTTELKSYTYSMEWRSEHVDSGAFHARDSDDFRSNCEVANPAWPAGLPAAGATYASSVDAGAFTLEGEYVAMVPLDAPVFASSTPSNWSRTEDGYTSDQWAVAGTNSSGIGRVRVSFKGTNWSAPMITVLGENTGGTVGRWTAPDAWLCSGLTLAELRQGEIGSEELLRDTREEALGVAWALRCLCFLAVWFGLSRIAAALIPGGPLAGCAAAAAFSGALALSHVLGVIGLVWIAMSPAMGVALLGTYIITWIWAAAVSVRARRRQRQRGACDAGPGGGEGTACASPKAETTSDEKPAEAELH